MLKKDPVFWWATGIFVLALGLFAATQNQFWLALMIGSYLLRPTLASLGVARSNVDERQMSIHYRSGNIGAFTGYWWGHRTCNRGFAGIGACFWRCPFFAFYLLDGTRIRTDLSRIFVRLLRLRRLHYCCTAGDTGNDGIYHHRL